MIKLVNKNVFLHHPRPVSKQRKHKKIKENRFRKSKYPLLKNIYVMYLFATYIHTNNC